MASSVVTVPNGTKPSGATPGAATPRVVEHTKTRVESYGNFPMVGSRLGDYFCLGKLGKGTFCSIHKCCALDYWRTGEKARTVAAKVELSTFANSGVLEGEALMLRHLDSSLPRNTVPLYLGHLESDKYSAVIMEYLDGSDMHQLREGLGTRRVSVEDAVFLTADVLIPLLRNMHEAGVVHRDVKPSNCVRRDSRDFVLVDFGLSKTIIVPKESPNAGSPFNSTHCLRKEREKADFRGTSMYASLRVHQLKDYSFRDDMWSVLYVFCDLVSGGLPWMSYAANRDRETCEKMKQDIFENKKTYTLLQGDAYHVAQFKYDKMEKDGATDLPQVPEPLEISKDPEKIKALEEAFEHLGMLSFDQKPDYTLLQDCLCRFKHGDTYDKDVPRIKFDANKHAFSPSRGDLDTSWDSDIPKWNFPDVHDPLESGVVWKDASMQAESEQYDVSPGSEASDFWRLPVEFQFRIAQMQYHTQHFQDTPHYIALRDFMNVALPVLYGRWDSTKFEKGNHRSDSDGYRRELYVKVIDMCLDCASNFANFSLEECYDDLSEGPAKRRRITNTLGKSSVVAVSQVISGLHSAKKQELKKLSAPPPALNFGQG